MLIEVETGTYTGQPRKHNGYYAGDFSDTPFQWSPLYAQGVVTPVETTAPSGRNHRHT